MKPQGKQKSPAIRTRATHLLRTFTLTLASNRANIHKVGAFLSKIRHAIPMEDELYGNIMISLTEAVNNAIVHGNRENPVKSVRVRCECYADRFVFFVEDEGSGFNPDSLPDPLAEENLLKEGGRGVLIIRALMSDVSYREGVYGLILHFTAYRDRKARKV